VSTDSPLASITVRRSTQSPVLTFVGVIGLVIALTAAPWIFPQAFVSILVNFFVLLIMATMWNLLAGYAGMVSIGQQAFVGLGGYGVLYFALKGVSPFLAVPMAVIVGAVIAIPITFLLIRLRGGYFAIATWVVADTVMIIIGTVSLLGGGTGKLVPGFTSLSPTQLNHYAYLETWLVALAVLVGTYLLLRSRTGLVLAAIRDNEVAARSVGIDVVRARRLIFVIAAAGCAAAGAVLTLSQTYVQPTNEFSIQWAAEMLFVSMIGGLGTIEGPILGCIIFFGLQQTLAQQGAWYLVILGSVAIIVALWQPRGLWGAVRDKFGIELLPVGHWVGSRGEARSPELLSEE
jgi:branched-chain amino acid transport system permease protein